MSTSIPTVDQIVARMKAEILDDMAEGHVPTTISTFSELHDHTDANLYGGAEELLDLMDLDEALILIGPAQDTIHAWLARGEHRVAR